MGEAPAEFSATTDKSTLVALIVMARYHYRTDPAFADYLTTCYHQAKAAGLSAKDLRVLRKLAEAIGRTL